MNTPIALRLAIRQWRARPLRPVLCALAIAAAVALIVVVGAAMDSLHFTIANAIGQNLGVAEIHIRPAQRGTEARVPGSLLHKMRARPDVELASARLASLGVLTKNKETFWFDVVGIDEPNDELLRPKIFLSGHTLTGPPDEILIDTMIADKMELKLGDVVTYTIKENPPRQLRIVGILKRPAIEFIAKPTMFVPLAVLAKDLALPEEYSVIDLKLREPSAGLAGAAAGGASGAEIDFDLYAKTLGKELGPSVEVSPGTKSKANMADATRTLRILLSLLSMLSAVCASLIIGTTLSVGVQERVRQFGQLRCLGASRPQLAVILLGDALVMLALGEVIGITLGLATAAVLVAQFPHFFLQLVLTPASLLIAAGCGAFATFLGALIPIWQVTRVSPMAAVNAVALRARISRVRLAAGIGILCLIVQQVLWHSSTSRDFRIFSYIFVGVNLIFIGWCLLAPLAVVSCERLGAIVLGRLFFVRPSLLRNAWSRTPWRAGAMIAALMIGVTIFTTVRARGQSLLTSFPTPQIPDLVVKSLFGGFTDQRLARLQREHPELRDLIPLDYFEVSMKIPVSVVGKIVGDEKTTFIAVDLRKFAALVTIDFQQGDAAGALAAMDDGRHVFVSTEFAATRKLGLGDKILFKAADGKDIEFSIAAIVSSTSVEMVKNYFDLRAEFGQQSVASVIGAIPDARKYFMLGDPSLLLLNVDPARHSQMTKLRDQLAAEGLQSLSAVEMKASLHTIITRLIDGLTIIGIGALCLASLGVANMVIASIHARRYEFGVLRAIGAGRAQLIRLVLAEVTLIGFIAGILGACAGLWYTFMISRVDRVLIGLQTCVINPDPRAAVLYALFLIALSIGLTTLLGWLAALVPAVRGSMTAQRTLLASGRG